ncbi:MAG: class I SAM-dependent methyltransferase [Thermoanaerobaculia bacterium]|jgi:SAM-dependent methyltransferase
MSDEYLFEHPGRCPICEKRVTFVARNPWFRDNLLCPGCGSIPRERALMFCIERFLPDWSRGHVHESSPIERGASIKLRGSARYVASQFDPSIAPGARGAGGWVNQDLEKQTFSDNSFDLVVTQDVFEHIFDIDAAAREIARTLRPGGVHVFTTPLINGTKPSEPTAIREADNSITHLVPPSYHGNPMSADGALVTWHFGFDLASRIASVSGLPTIVVALDRLDLGIRAEFIEVFISFKLR